MSSEQLADGVNPLDAELAATWDVLKGYSGRDTDLGIARRFGGAAAAYSLRDIGAMNGPVVKVRRMPYDVGDADGAGGNPDTSPNDETDFSANQVATGALEDWVNGKFENTLPADVATAAAAFSLRKVKASYSGNAVQIRRSSDQAEVDVAFDSEGKVSNSSLVTDVTEESESGATQVASSGATTLADFLNPSGSGTDAFVVTWYDQAGSNDAVQTTSANQPKIASSGALITENNNTAIDFEESSSQFLLISKAFANSSGADVSIFFVSKNVATAGNNAHPIISNRSGATNGYQFGYDGTDHLEFVHFANTANGAVSTQTFERQILGSAIRDNLTFDIFGNAVNKGDNTASGYVASTDFTRIGGNEYASKFMDGTMQEIVIFESDQTDNRFKIESNINNYYGLYNDANETSATEFSFRNERTGGVTVSNGLSGFTLDVETASAFAGFQLKQKVANTDVIYLSFNAVLTGGSGGDASPKVALRETGITNTVRSNEFDIKAGFNSVELISNNDNAEYLAFSEGDDNKIFTISDLKVSRIARNGFVETWYDQSSNGNDATQATASKQPKIVSNGGTNKLEGLPTINFDDATSHCLTSSSYSRSGSDLPLSMMAVFDKSTTDTDYLFAANKSNDDAFQRLVLRSSSFEYGERDDSNTQKIGTGGSPSLNTIFLMSAFTGGTTSSAFVNGSSIISDQDTDLGTQTFDQIDIGANNGDGASSANPFSGNISELYLFETNLSTDRTNIESEIANHYNITLS